MPSRQLPAVESGWRASSIVVTPVTELVAVLAKIRNGQITRLESLCRGGPFGMRTGWS